jgi:homoserine O-acetyltransferase
MAHPSLGSKGVPAAFYDHGHDIVTVLVAVFAPLAELMPIPADLGTVENRSFVITNFRLHNGTNMAEAKIAYETYGRLAPDGKNAVLITHGYTSGHHAAGRNPANGNLPGWWDGLIGPGEAIDTDRLFVVSSNMLGADARYFEIDSDLGHSASGPEHAKWSPTLREFLRPLMARIN